MNRFTTELGDTGLFPNGSVRQGTLRAFGALYRFQGRTWGIIVWAKDWKDAGRWCAHHGLRLDGEIVEVYEAE